MATTVELSVRIIPWDDPSFVRAVEAARDQVHTEGLTINGSKAAERAQEILRETGYPVAHVECEQTVQEAMAHCAHWTVRRDGPGA
jgi:hypothetical protein